MIRKALAIALIVSGCGLLLALLVAAPYVAYIGTHHGWLDERISWAPMGVPAALLGSVLAHTGIALKAGQI